jgi:3-hydroxyisobutyrate dehydrogenase
MMQRIAFLGLGAMGSRMAAHLIKAGHAVTVWNRGTKKAEPLVALGAKIAGTPNAAAANANIVISMLRDDDASRQVWTSADTGAMPAMRKGALAIECSTLTVEHIKSLANQAQSYGISFIDAPVAGSRPQADAAQLIFFAGGSVQDVAKAEPILKHMGGAVHHAGAAGSGAATKLMVNALFGIQLAALAELIGFAKKSGFDVAKLVEIIGATPVCSPAAKLAAGTMLAGNFAPMFPIDLVAKDFSYVERVAAAVSAEVPVSKATATAFVGAVASGLAAENITAIAKLYQ